MVSGLVPDYYEKRACWVLGVKFLFLAFSEKRQMTLSGIERDREELKSLSPKLQFERLGLRSLLPYAVVAC